MPHPPAPIPLPAPDIERVVRLPDPHPLPWRAYLPDGRCLRAAPDFAHASVRPGRFGPAEAAHEVAARDWPDELRRLAARFGRPGAGR